MGLSLTSVEQIGLLVHHVLPTFDFRQRRAIFLGTQYLYWPSASTGCAFGEGGTTSGLALGFFLVGAVPTAIPRSTKRTEC